MAQNGGEDILADKPEESKKTEDKKSVQNDASVEPNKTPVKKRQ